MRRAMVALQLATHLHHGPPAAAAPTRPGLIDAALALGERSLDVAMQRVRAAASLVIKLVVQRDGGGVIDGGSGDESDTGDSEARTAPPAAALAVTQ